MSESTINFLPAPPVRPIICEKEALLGYENHSEGAKGHFLARRQTVCACAAASIKPFTQTLSSFGQSFSCCRNSAPQQQKIQSCFVGQRRVFARSDTQASRISSCKLSPLQQQKLIQSCFSLTKTCMYLLVP